MTISNFMNSSNFKNIVIVGLLLLVGLWYFNVIHPKQLSNMAVPSPQNLWDSRTSQGIPQPSQIMGKNENPISSQSMPMSVNDPSQLLPKDVNSEWSQVNPRGSGQLQNINLLSAGALIGINTVGSTLRNPNLQLRSEPANPQNYNGPWLNSTIQPDLMRVPLEIGQGSQ